MDNQSLSKSISALLYKPYGLKEYQLSKNIYLRGLWTVNVCLTNKENKTGERKNFRHEDSKKYVLV